MEYPEKWLHISLWYFAVQPSSDRSVLPILNFQVISIDQTPFTLPCMMEQTIVNLYKWLWLDSSSDRSSKSDSDRDTELCEVGFTCVTKRLAPLVCSDHFERNHNVETDNEYQTIASPMTVYGSRYIDGNQISSSTEHLTLRSYATAYQTSSKAPWHEEVWIATPWADIGWTTLAYYRLCTHIHS